MSIIATLLSGGVTGLIGTIWSSYNKRKERELDLKDRQANREHELKMVSATTKATLAKIEAGIQQTKTETEGKISLAETEVFKESIKQADKPMITDAYVQRLFDMDGWIKYLTVPIAVLLCVLFTIVDFIKGVIRPAITMYSLGIATWVTYKSWLLLEQLANTGTAAVNTVAVGAASIAPSFITADMATTIVINACNIIFYLTVTTVTWWYGDRSAGKLFEGMTIQGVQNPTNKK